MHTIQKFVFSRTFRVPCTKFLLMQIKEFQDQFDHFMFNKKN